MADPSATKIIAKSVSIVQLVAILLNLYGSMFIINIYATSFTKMCKLISEQQSVTHLNRKVQNLIQVLKSLKRGMSPMALMLCTLSVTILLNCAYLVTQAKDEIFDHSRLYLLVGMVLQIIFIFNVCWICQESYEEFQGLKNVLR